LTKLDDTPFSCPADTYLRVVQEEGFQIIYQDNWTGKRRYEQEAHSETHYVLWHDDGLLLNYDTHHGHRNAGNVYFNWKSNNQEDLWPGIGISGGLEVPKGMDRMTAPREHLFFCGHMDSREAIRYKLNRLRREGSFIKQWMHSPTPYLTAYWHWPDDNAPRPLFDIDGHNAKITHHFPEHVRKAIGI